LSCRLRSLLAGALLTENENGAEDLERKQDCDPASREEVTHYRNLGGLVLGAVPRRDSTTSSDKPVGSIQFSEII
jgi:hypothetical protein